MFHKDFVPFVRTPTDVIPHILNALKLDEQSVLYDLGCGDGKIVSACHTACPTATCIGIEKQMSPYFLGCIRHRKKFSEKFKLIRDDIFHHTYTDTTHITTYLFPFLMDELLPKLQKELRPGTKVISIDFPFSKKQYTDIIHTSRSLYLTGRKIYVYEF